MAHWSRCLVVAAVAALACAVGATGMMARTAADIPVNMPPCPLASVQTGDVVLFRWDGTDAVHDLVSAFSHVGLVVTRGTEPWILETHKDGDARSMGREGGGVRAYRLADRVRTYPGAAWVLKLDRGRWDVRSGDVEAAFAALERVPYDADHKPHVAGCVVNAILGVRGPRPDRRAMYCSEFVGELLRRAGVLPAGYDTSCLTPASFAHMPDVYPRMLRLR